jgi:hypothetical protein
MKIAIMFLTLISVYNLFAYWSLEYRIDKLSEKKPAKSKKKTEAIKSHKKAKSLSRPKF